MSELPRGWASATIAEVVVERVRQGEPTTTPVPYIDISAIDRDRKVIGQLETVTAQSAPTRARQWVEANDVLVSMTRPNLNAVAMVAAALAGSVASTGFDVLRAKGVLPEWLFARVRSQAFVEELCSGIQGVVYPAVRPQDIRKQVLPVPPLNEQRRIVEAIDSYLSRLDAAVESLTQAQNKLKAYRASVLKAAVEGRLVPTEAELAKAEGRTYEPADKLLERILAERRRAWEERQLADMKAKGKEPKDDKWKANYPGPSPVDLRGLGALPPGWCWTSTDAVGDILLGRRRAPEYTGPIRKYLRVANIKDDVIDFDHLEEMPFDDIEFEKYRLEAGDILLSEGQSLERVGQSAIFHSHPEPLCFQATLHRFRPAWGGPRSPYAQVVFRSNVKTGVFMRLASITTNIAHLTLGKLKAAPFPLAPEAEQERLARECDRVMSFADAAERQIESNLRRCARLRQSILKAAFEGQLVDQDPNDEPASELLARLRATPESAAETPKRGRKPKKTTS